MSLNKHAWPVATPSQNLQPGRSMDTLHASESGGHLLAAVQHHVTWATCPHVSLRGTLIVQANCMARRNAIVQH
jgi:hypothetical protein